jgi:AraC-like DNA-binding protein
MDFSILHPSASLAPYVKQYWAMDSFVNPGINHLQRIVPNGFLECTFYLGDTPTYLRNEQAEKNYAMISGQQYGFYDISVSGHLQLFSIVFSPFGARYLLDFPLSELKNQSIPANYILRKYGDEISEQLHLASSQEHRKQIVEKYFIKVLEHHQQWNLDRFSAIFQLINQTKGNVNILELASEACLSRKQFERSFTDHVGISPKKYLRIIRFQHVLHIKQLNPPINLTKLALAGNYYDQSHMINDFRYLTGFSPKEYFDKCLPYSDYFN